MTNSTNLPLLIFDLDGTLIDSAADIQVAMNRMLKKYNRDQVDLDILINHIGDGLTKLVNDFFPEYHLNSDENNAKVEEFLSLYSDEHLTSLTTLYPGVYEFLSEYKGPKALITNKNIKPTLQIFDHYKLRELDWVDIIGGDSLSERKPSPLGLQTVMKKINYKPTNTWMIGDGRPDMKSAQAAGCNKAAVHYGYSKPEELDPFKPELVLKNFSDLKNLLNL
ncbi:MAG: HAD hydrolase-like protein [Pseudobdellovibrio sp.]